MKLFFNIAFVSFCISAQNQGCMDRCGREVDKCHQSCNERYAKEDYEPCCEEYCDYLYEECHNKWRSTMCRCFKSCGCPECCGYQRNAPNLADENVNESEKTEASQFLKRKSDFQN